MCYCYCSNIDILGFVACPLLQIDNNKDNAILALARKHIIYRYAPPNVGNFDDMNASSCAPLSQLFFIVLKNGIIVFFKNE